MKPIPTAAQGPVGPFVRRSTTGARSTGPVSATPATERARTCWCLRLRGPRHRVCAAPGSPLDPMVSRVHSVTCIVPLVEVAQRARHLCDYEVRFPNRQGLSKLCDDEGEGAASGTAGEFPHALLELVESLVGHLELGTVAADREARELAVHGPIDRAVATPTVRPTPRQWMHGEPQRVNDEACHAGHRPLAPYPSRLPSGFCSSPRSFGLGFQALAELASFQRPGARQFAL